jgi:phosphoribosylaminoimidazolecarboxamide formyltransferase/IMP cyclohydrolase
MRQHPSITGIRFKAGVKRQDKVNARVRIIEGNLTPEEREEISAKIEGEMPAPLSEVARAEFMKTLPPISLSSDAFFPYVAHNGSMFSCIFNLFLHSFFPPHSCVQLP